MRRLAFYRTIVWPCANDYTHPATSQIALDGIHSLELWPEYCLL